MNFQAGNVRVSFTTYFWYSARLLSFSELSAYFWKPFAPLIMGEEEEKEEEEEEKEEE